METIQIKLPRPSHELSPAVAQLIDSGKTLVQPYGIDEQHTDGASQFDLFRDGSCSGQNDFRNRYA